MTMESKVSRPLGRPRSEEAQRKVLDAAYALLTEQGPAKFSIEAVSLRSGVSRPTIYRWWPSKGRLAIESFLDAFAPLLAHRTTGNPAADFEALLASLARALAGPAGRVAASVLAQAQDEPELQELFLKDFSEPLRRRSSILLEAGVGSGHFRADLNIPRVLDSAVGAVYLRLLFGQSIDPTWAGELIDTLMKGCLAT